MYICSAMNDIYYKGLYARSNNDIIVDLGRKFKEYRIALRLTQKEIAEQTGMSIMTIVRFERGEGSSIRLDNFIALLRTIQKLDAISEIIPDVPLSLYDSPSVSYKVKQRVRKRRDEK